MNKTFKYDKAHYDSDDEFIHEFTCYNNFFGPCSYGLDFMYHGKEYRISRDRCDTKAKWEYFKKVFNRKVGTFYLAISSRYVDKLDPVFSNRFHTVLGIFDDVYDLLENGSIEGRKFKDIILDKETELLSTD